MIGEKLRNKIVISVCLVATFIGGLSYFYSAGSSQGMQGKYVAFDESMLKHRYGGIFQRSDYQYVYEQFKRLYEKNSFARVQPQQTTRIPKILHLMWLGGKVPSEYDEFIASWKRYHPHWTVLFWTDNELNYDQGVEVVSSFDALQKRLNAGDRVGLHLVVDMRDLSFDNRGFYDQAQNYGERSDILKWEIVYRFGGVYVDTDFECFQPLDVFNHTYDFYTGVQPLDTNIVQLGAALYGAIPRHPILRACVANIKDNQHIIPIIHKTGPLHFTKTVLGLMGKTGLRDIVFPSSYFYPCGYDEDLSKKVEWCKPESYAVHHWAGSWLKPEAFVYS